MSSSKSYTHHVPSSSSRHGHSHHTPHPYDYYSSSRLSGQYTPTTPERSSQASSHDPYAYAPPLSPFNSHHGTKSDKSARYHLRNSHYRHDYFLILCIITIHYTLYIAQ